MSISYDLEKVKELAGGDESFVEILLQTFLEEIPEDLKNMSDAVAVNDAKVAYQYAHKMKPNFQLFGIDVIDHIKRIESWANEEITFDEAKVALLVVEEKAEKAIVSLRELLNK
ncbi:Hpt domain-containing protein [Aquimarina agarilytica]|uniref:Hpt domain-containing protein n=1 Tax=Aquimarina agarilytica TaxID=1087449 RepID=UPI00028946B9|nr:Hpt domain-containing protein [Aquimarina agarilytica]